MKQTPMAVPAVERRRGKRILTLRNFRNVLLILLGVILVLNIRSEMRNTTGDDEYGRLYGRELQKAPVVAPAAVTEREIAPVPESPSADPFSLDAAAREQFLGRPSLTPEPVFTPVADDVWSTPAPRSEERLRIVGGPDGVTLEREERPQPVLGGGFGQPRG